MKVFKLTLLAIFGTVLSATAQIKASDKAVIKTPTLQQCDECIEKLQLLLSREEGVVGLKIDAKKKTITVTWLTDRTTKENIKVAIANLGYVADDIEAEETAYKKLPKCCKIPDAVVAPKKG
ncbi:MAG: copper chaperone [Chitinophagaceae bacterium]|nr:copper chaperone [Chitinophagaceae bacterium]